MGTLASATEQQVKGRDTDHIARSEYLCYGSGFTRQQVLYFDKSI